MDRHIAPAMVAIGLSFAANAFGGERVRDLLVVEEGGLGAAWMLAPGSTIAAPTYPAEFAGSGREVCMAFGYLVQPDGTTSDFRVLQQWNSLTGGEEPERGFWEAFAQSGAQAVSQWRFQPRPEVTVPEATYTVATLGWQAGRKGDPGGTRNRCRIRDLANTLRGDRDTGLNDHLIDREYRAENRFLQAVAGEPH